MADTTALILSVDSRQVKAAAGDLGAFADAGAAAEAGAKRTEKAAGASSKAFAGTAKTARELNFALRGVPAQFTDIATSLAAGQNPLQVFLQQGGQLKDMFGGAGPAARALGGYVAGLVNPFTIAAAAAATLGVAYNQGSKEADAYAKALILSGNAAGSTVGQLQAMAESIDGIVGTQAAAAEALALFAGASNVAAGSLERFATIAIKMERETGQAVGETVKQFNELGRSPVQASAKLNESLRYLTLTTYAQIRALEEQGRTADAAALAQKTYADAMETRAGQLEQRLGTIERAWRGIKDGAKEAWDAMLGIGRASTLQDQLASAQKQLADRQARGPLNPTTAGAHEKGNETLRQQIAFLGEQLRLETRVADSQKIAGDRVKARIDFDKEGEKFLANRVKMEREITQARNMGAAAGASQAEIEKRIGDIRAKYAEKGDKNKALMIDRAELAGDISSIRAAGEQLAGIYSTSEKIIESLRSAGILSDKEYYESKRAFINLESAAKEDALRKEIARLDQEKLVGKDRIDNDRKIAEAQSKLAILRADSAAQLVVLSNQEEAAAKRIQLSYLSMRQAAQDYFDSIERQQERGLAGVGRGTQARGRDAGINQIEDRYSGQRLDLENQKARLELEGKFTDEARTQYEARRGIIDEFQNKSIASYSAYYDRLIESQGNWANGASESLANYLSESQNVAKQTENLFVNAFKGMEDALVSFVQTGKLDFKSLANSIIADMIRIQVRQSVGGKDGIAGLLLGLFGGKQTTAGIGGAGGINSGLPAYGLATGTNYVPRDNFPALLHKGEAVVPARYNPANGGAGGASFSPSISIYVDSRTDQEQVGRIAYEASSAAVGQFAEQLRAQGAIA